MTTNRSAESSIVASTARVVPIRRGIVVEPAGRPSPPIARKAARLARVDWAAAEVIEDLIDGLLAGR
jgi:beta-phosphoglucomutase-like phosphatase (HAD superfamily)